MRIAIASSGLGHVTRGIESWAEDLARALALQGQPALLFKGSGRADAEFERVIPCLERSARVTERLEKLFRRGLWRVGLGSAYEIEQTTFAIRLLPHLRRESVDILHVQDPHVALIVQQARRLGLVPTRTILGHGTNEPLDFLRKITYLQQLAPHHLESARSQGVWKLTWTAIPNFVDTDVFRPGRSESLRRELRIPSEALVLLSVAAIKRSHKRIGYLLEESGQLVRSSPDLPVWFVVAGGRERDTDELVARAHELLGDRVRMLVRFPRERMPDLYRCADVFVLSSLREMMPIALMEATASGLPCLVNRHPVLEWMTGPGGESVDMEGSGALAAALGQLLRDPARRQVLGDRSREHCLSQFDRRRVISQILSYYVTVSEDGGCTEQRARS